MAKAIQSWRMRRQKCYGQPGRQTPFRLPRALLRTSPCPECDGSCAVKSTKPAYDALAYRRELEKHSEPPAPPMPKPTPELKIPPEFWAFRVQIRAGNGGDDPGQILEGRFGVVNDLVYVEDDQGKPVDMQCLRPGENAAAVAQRILREKWRNRSPNAPAGFYDGPINRTFH